MKKNIKAVVFDLDGTLVKFDFGDFGSSWEAVARACGVQREFADIQRRYYSLKGKEKEWAETSAQLFRGNYVRDIQDRIGELPYSKNVREAMNYFNGVLKGCLSSGVDIVAERVGEELGLDFVVCSKLEQEKGKLTGRVSFRVPLWKKGVLLVNLLNRYNVSLDESVYVGDDDNCISCFERVGVSVAFQPKTEETRKAVDYVINDFRELGGILEN